MNRKILIAALFALMAVLLGVFTISCSENKEEALENETVFEGMQEQVSSEIIQNIPEIEQEEAPEKAEPENASEAETEPESEPEPETEPEPAQEPVIKHISVTGITLTIYDVTLPVGHQTMPIVTMSPYNATNKGEIWKSSDTSVATVDRYGNIKGVSEGNCTVTVTSSDNAEIFATVNVKIIPEAECTYIDGILIANKTYPLPQSYAPGWDTEASEQLKVMFDAAAQDGISLWVKSGYRSYIDQKIIYNGYVARDGKEAADTYSARPGHSEHQTGLAFDLNSIDFSFADTPEAAWIAENSYKYGFIIRYPKDKESITGYMYEPWHVRYLGVEKATEVYESGLCLEEFLGITSVYSY